MTSNVDIVQTNKYKQMLGLTNINSNTKNSTLVASVTILGGLYVSQYSNLLNKITILSDFYVSNNTNFYINITNKANLNINNNAIIENDSTIMSNINCSNMNINGGLLVNNKILGNLVSLNNIKVSSISQFNSTLQLNNIIALNDTLNLNANNINIGNINSTINIYGTSTYMAVNEVKVLDKLISLNLKSNNMLGASTLHNNISIDNGKYCGIQILSSSGIGFIRTNKDATRYEIKAPMDNNINYIATVDYDNNLSISGTTILYGSSTVYSSLLVNGNTILQGNTIFNSTVITSGNSILQNSITELSNLLISGNTIFNGNTTMNSSFYIGGAAIFNNSLTINSSLNINGNTSIDGSITLLSQLNIFGDTLLQGKTSLNSKLYISNTTILQGTTTFNSSLNINGYSNILGNTTVYSNLNISNISLLQGSTNLNSNLFVNGNVIIDGNMTIGSIINFNNNDYSNFSNLYILSQMIANLADYKNNTEAIVNGVPLWGFYRTGGILKIRLDDTPPTLTLLGNSSISINNNTNYIEPGVIAIDYNGRNITPYLISIINNNDNSNIITDQIELDNNNKIINNTNTLSIGNYTINYIATDTTGNIGIVSRTLNIVNSIIFSSYNNSDIDQLIDISGTLYSINNGNLINGNNVLWMFSDNVLSLVDFNSSWSVVLKARSISWGDILQINFDPIINSNIINCGVSNITFKDSLYYFSNDPTYWTSSFAPSNFYSNFNSIAGIYIIISRNGSTGYLTVSFYDNTGSLIDSKNSNVPFYYSNFNSLFSITSLVSITWLNGYIIHRTDNLANVLEYQNYFGV